MRRSKTLQTPKCFDSWRRGKSDFDREHEAKIQSAVPANFWEEDAKAAAMALLEANRTPAHRAAYQLALDGRDNAKPPERCTLTLTGASSRCYQANDAHFFLRVDPEDCYLAYAESRSAGVVFFHAVHTQPAFDFRLCRLPYKDARKISDVIWWLNRARSKYNREDRDQGHSFVSSTGDGSVAIGLRGDGETLIEHSGTYWSDYLSGRWTENYTPITFVNFAANLMTRALPARLGNAWTQHEPKSPLPYVEKLSAPNKSPEEQKRLRELVEQFLMWFSPEQDHISFAVVSEAAHFVGWSVQADTAARLQTIESALPRPARSKRRWEEVSAELEKLSISYGMKRPEREKAEKRRAELNAELSAIVHGLGQNSAESLQKVLSHSLRQIAEGNDADRLLAWVKSKSEGFQWAFQRLAQVDRKRYAEAVEILVRSSEAQWARQYFDELQEIDPPRAQAIVRDLPKAQAEALAVSAFQFLRKAEALPDEAQRIAALISVVHNPKVGFEERSRAIDTLVPEGQPMRYPGREIDEALLHVFKPGQADDLTTYTLEHACRALARRGRVDLFDRIAGQIEKKVGDELGITGAHKFHGVLGALTHLAQADPEHLNPRLVAIVKPELSMANKQVTEVLWAIWAANLRQLQGEVERLSTGSPDDYEDRKANSFGGKPSRVEGRFHLARQFTAVWKEPEPFTRARLLVALTAMNAYPFTSESWPARRARMKTEMGEVAGALSPNDRTKLAAFLDRMEADPPEGFDRRLEVETCKEVGAFAREAFGLK